MHRIAMLLGGLGSTFAAPPPELDRTRYIYILRAAVPGMVPGIQTTLAGTMT